MERDTLHQIWCGSKPILGLACLLANHEGQTDLRRCVNSVASFMPGALANNPATMWDVLCHDAGLVDPSAFQLLASSSLQRSNALDKSGWRRRMMPAYSEVQGWRLLAALLEETSLGAVGWTDRVLGLTGVDRNSLLVSQIDVPRAGDRIGVYFSDLGAERRPFPILSDLTNHVLTFITPALGGLASAEGLATFYHGICESMLLRSLLKSSLSYRRGREYDFVLKKSCDFAGGFMVEVSDHGFGDRLGAFTFGHSGWMGSSWGFCELEMGLSVGFVHNGFVDAHFNNIIRRQVVEWVLDEFVLRTC